MNICTVNIFSYLCFRQGSTLFLKMALGDSAHSVGDVSPMEQAMLMSASNNACCSSPSPSHGALVKTSIAGCCLTASNSHFSVFFFLYFSSSAISLSRLSISIAVTVNLSNKQVLRCSHQNSNQSHHSQLKCRFKHSCNHPPKTQSHWLLFNSFHFHLQRISHGPNISLNSSIECHHPTSQDYYLTSWAANAQSHAIPKSNTLHTPCRPVNVSTRSKAAAAATFQLAFTEVYFLCCRMILSHALILLSGDGLVNPTKQ